MKIDIIETLDGSHTLYLEDIDEHYHSTFGAIQESQHVYIHAGLDSCSSNDIRILEIGFGTGLNCYLTLLSYLNSNKKIRYFSVEKYPLPADIWGKLNFGDYFPKVSSKLFSLLHKVPWNCEVEIQPQFFLHKIEADLMQLDFKNMSTFDLVYFDAFSPDKQPALWDQSIFEKLYSNMTDNSILVTYCAKGYVRRILQATGFQVERIPGPPGKREMMRARKG